MSMDNELKSELNRSLSRLDVPESLFRFAEQVPEICGKNTEETVNVVRPQVQQRIRMVPAAAKTAAAALILTVTFSVGIMASPAFASYMKQVPGFDIAVSWLMKARHGDGVQNAVNNRYTPIEPVTASFGNTKITVADIYLTDEELIFKTYMSTEDYDVTDPDPTTHFSVGPVNIPGAGGSTTSRMVIEPSGDMQGPVLQESYKYVFDDENGAREFLEKNEPIRLRVHKMDSHRERQEMDFTDVGEILVPVDRSKLLHNKVSHPDLSLPFAVSDPDIRELKLEKLSIQPTSINAVLSIQEGWKFDFPLYESESPYLRDDKGNVYPYSPGGSVRMLEDGKMQLPFASSMFFDDSVETLYLHVGEVSVYEKEASGSFEVSEGDSFPKTVTFKNKQIVIEQAEYRDGYVYLKLKKPAANAESLRGVHYFSREFQNTIDTSRIDLLNQQRVELGIPGWGSAFGFKSGKPYVEVYIPVLKKQENYRFELQRVNDTIKVNQDFPIRLK